jgi:acyl dehydratase
MQVPFEGYEFIYQFRFSQKDVNLFAKATGDFNPIHLDEKYASQTPFKRPIVHGFLSGSIFSKVFGTIYPGEGTIYVEQHLKFKRPMFVETDYVANFIVTHVDKKEGLVTLNCKVINEIGKDCIEGQAVLLNKRVFIVVE